MRIAEALVGNSSQLLMATGKSARGQQVVAAHTRTGLRIVKGVTDSTVVRKLTRFELLSDDWQPVEETEGA